MSEFHEGLLVCAIIFTAFGLGMLFFHGLGLIIMRLLNFRDPGPVLCIYPDELTASENNQDRIQPMIKTGKRPICFLMRVR